MIIIISLKSHNKKSIEFFIYWLKNLTINFFNKTNKNKIKKIKICLLKSPHVHKYSQDHYEKIMYKYKLLIMCFNIKKFLFVEKIIKNFSFFDIFFKYKFFYKYVNFFQFKNFFYKIFFKIMTNKLIKLNLKNNKFKKIKIIINYLNFIGKNMLL